MTEEDLRKYISDGVDRAKAGEALNVYHAIQPMLNAGAIPARSHYAAGWIIYYALHQTPDKITDTRKRMLADYLALRVPRPHKLHSMILTEAIRLYKDVKNAAFNNRDGRAPKFSIIKFAALWHLTNLRPGDWRRKSLEGKDLTSTVEKLITVSVDELEETRTSPSPEFMEIMNMALREYPESFTLMAQRAALHRISGEHTLGADLLRRAILLAPGKFFLWSDLAATIDSKENPRLKVALLYKALTAPGPEQFKGRIRLSLAEIWSGYGAHSKALWELERVKRIYESQGWHLPATYVRLADTIPADTEPEDPAPSYRKLLPLAEDEIYSALPPLKVSKTYHKVATAADAARFGIKGNKGISWRVTDAEGNNYWLQPARFGIDPALPLQTPLTIRVHNGRTVKAELLPSQSS